MSVFGDGQSKEINQRFHTASRVYPTGAVGAAVSSGDAAPWTLGAFVEIVPINTITSEFDIDYINIEQADNAAIYELVIYAGAVEISRYRISAVGIPATVLFHGFPIHSVKLPANTQIQAKIMSDTGNVDTLMISLVYHIH